MSQSIRRDVIVSLLVFGTLGSVGVGGCGASGDDGLTIMGQVVDSEGRAWSDEADITIVTFEEYVGLVPNESAPDFSAKARNGTFKVTVPARRWGVLAARGTCNSAPLEEAKGDPGHSVAVVLKMYCNL